MRKKILFTAGGTGGHILPTVSLVNFFEKNYDIVLVSDSRAKKYFKFKLENIYMTYLYSESFLVEFS